MTKGRAPKDIRDRRSRRSPTPQPTTKTWRKVPRGIFLGSCTVLSLLVGIGVVFQSKLSVEASGSLRSSDPMGTVFHVSNDGVLPLYDLVVICGAKDIEFGSGNVKNIGFLRPQSSAAVLSPGHKMDAACAHAVVSTSTAKAELTIVVNYRRPLTWWSKTDEFPLKAERGADGAWVWSNVAR
jgi:hypothetical protein